MVTGQDNQYHYTGDNEPQIDSKVTCESNEYPTTLSNAGGFI